jgi:acyl-[acyl-carrier-protein]-phospholipid O-acyltransferase/long-chain-fatty-acid--[acyl-carrier-protein] ligase
MSTTQAPPRRALHGHLLACIVGASIDNIFRYGVGVTFAALAAARFADPTAREVQLQEWNNLLMLLFLLPFLILAPTAGSLGDRWPKHYLIRAARLTDVAICAVGILGIYLQSVPLMLTTVALLAVVSSFFAPVKLAVVPELVSDADLPSANGKLAGLTVLAILAGTGLSAFADSPLLLTAIVAVLCVVGVIGAWMIPPLAAKAPTTPIAMPWSLIRTMRSFSRTKGLWVPALALAGFWALGAVASLQLVPLIKLRYDGAWGYQASTIVAGCAMCLGVGLVVGSVLAARFVSRAFPAGLPIFGALLAGSTLAAAGYVASHGGSVAWFALAMCGAGVGAGLWEVPVTMLLQERAAPEQRNLVMGGVTILSNLGSIVLVLCLMPLTQGAFGVPWTSSSIYLLVGGGTVSVALLCAWVYRLQVVAWLVSCIARTLWRMEVTGQEHLPDHGGCLIVANHLSYADGIALCAKLKRPVRFLVYRKFFSVPGIGFLLRAVGAIPVAAEDGRRALVASLDAAVEALQRGEVVAIFPEGKLTRSGAMDVFKGGLERIASRANVPVVPVYLDGLYGTWMSRSTTREWFRIGRRVEVRVGAALPTTVTAGEARQAVCELGNAAAQEHADAEPRTLGMAALGLMRQHPRAVCIRDAQGQLANWQVMGIARALVPALELKDDDQRVGMLLPPGRAGVLLNLALAIAGRTAINLNHTSGAAALERMCEMAGIRTIITAGPYLKRITDAGLTAVIEKRRVIRAEELIPRVSKATILWQTALGMILPTRWLCRGKASDIATIIFSSGSTGDPKGVQLTHRQVLANCRAVRQGLDLQVYRDVILSPLPLFHSFGLVPGMWLGLTHGLSIAAHPDPTDGATIGKLAAELKATFLISTPTFVRGWMRRIEPEQFKTLRLAVVGAERCPAELKAAFKERYNCDLLEGYGCTELAPTVSVNLPEVRRDGEIERRSRDGSVGRPLPGLAAFTVHPDTLAPLPLGETGLIVIRSPSRMQGYLDRDDLTAKTQVAGGYNTGDIGRVDAEGFIHITGRLARFAKIGGEMVPLDNIEVLLQGAMPEDIELAVAAVADESRGERLVVLHTGFTGDWAEVLTRLDAQPALWKPRTKDIRQVPAIPKLGTGKRDLAALKALAASPAAAAAPAAAPAAAAPAAG